MSLSAPMLALMMLAASPAGSAAPASAGGALAETLSACESWVLEPKSWADGIAGFPRQIGLQDRLQPRSAIPAALLPPPQMRQGMHFWFEAAGRGAGVFLTTSDVSPSCHIAAGGPIDFQPLANALLSSPDFGRRWHRIERKGMADMLVERYASTIDPKLEITISRAAQPGGRTDRVQFLATAHYKLGN